MAEPTSSAEVVRADVASEGDAAEERTAPNTSAALEYWHSTLQELYKNPPPHHAYVANPLAPGPPAYGLWSSQIPPALLTPYAPMPFFGGFLPGAYTIPPPATAMPTASLPAVKPEVREDAESRSQSPGDLQPRKRRKCPTTTGNSVAATSLLVPPHSMPSPTINRTCGDDTWTKAEDDEGNPNNICDDSEIKRERRKQSNRESARRSRLRKQRECEALQKQAHDVLEQNRQLKEELLDAKQHLKQLEEENRRLKQD